VYDSRPGKDRLRAAGGVNNPKLNPKDGYPSDDNDHFKIKGIYYTHPEGDISNRT